MENVTKQDLTPKWTPKCYIRCGSKLNKNSVDNRVGED